MPFLRRKAGGFRTVPKDAEELRAVKPSTLLRREQIVRSVGVSIPEPSSERRLFIQLRLPLVPVNRLDRVERAFQPPNREAASLHVQVPQLQIADLRGATHWVSVLAQRSFTSRTEGIVFSFLTFIVPPGSRRGSWQSA